MKTGLYDTEGPSFGENPGELGELQRELAWELEHKKNMLESQRAMAKRIKDLENALWNVLALCEEQKDPALKSAWKVLREKI
jgi:hypothetical protein